MNIGDLEDSLLNVGKEKGKDLADSFLSEQAEGGGLQGTAVGYGKDLLDNALGGGKQDEADDTGENRGKDKSSDDDSDDYDSGDDNCDDDRNDR